MKKTGPMKPLGPSVLQQLCSGSLALPCRAFHGLSFALLFLAYTILSAWFSHGDLQLVLDFIAFRLARFHGHV